MKKILGLDLGTNSIGWAYVLEDENKVTSEIIQIGSRVIPLSVDEQTNFEKGKSFSVNESRTEYRSARRNKDRYQDRREKLIEILLDNKIIDKDAVFAEVGSNSTHSTWKIRAKSATEKISLNDFARVLLAINKQRGYKSMRKAKTEEEGEIIDGMNVAKTLNEENITPGQFVFRLLNKGIKYTPDFYRSDLLDEFNTVWDFQKQFYPEILTDEFYKEVQGVSKTATNAIFKKKYDFFTAQSQEIDKSFLNEKTFKYNKTELKKLQNYKWRNDALTQKLEKEEVAFVLAEINNNYNSSSGYLGAISDRSKELYFKNITVGQYMYAQLKKDFHTSLKNQVFYRQDYIDEFEKVWNTQAQFYPQMTEKLKNEIKNKIIFYQRPLKSQKGLLGFCEFESKEIEIIKNDKPVSKTIGLRVCPKSSPLFQEFKIWQILHNIEVANKNNYREKRRLTQDEKEFLFKELNIRTNISANEVLQLLSENKNDKKLNYTKIEGNRTVAELYNAFLKIIDISGHDLKEVFEIKSTKDEITIDDITKLSAEEIKNRIKEVLNLLNINTDILEFNAELEGKEFENQALYQLWHLLYSYEGDNSVSGNEKLYIHLKNKFGFEKNFAQVLANIPLQDDYGNLSTKAMRKIYPFIKELEFDKACEQAGYRHSKHSLTKEELANRVLKNRLELLPKNSLRQPVVEKILNQMINVINTLIDRENDKLETQGKERNFHFDEIRIELARELKKNAKERDEMTQGINKANANHERIIKILQNDFYIKNPSRNDIIRYKLYEELSGIGYKDVYTNTYIPKELIFSQQIDIEHIIPKSRLFTNSFSNLTLSFKDFNIRKGSNTAYDFILQDEGENKLQEYINRVETLYNHNKKNKEEGINKAKYQNLLKKGSEIGDGFIERDLRETQYIAKKAKEILFEITPSVLATSGQITDRLREDWGLIEIMKELSIDKYRELGLTEIQEKRDGRKIEVIKDWTKRNDHRHHAMDALTVAFTKRSYIQYLNNLNARRNSDENESIKNDENQTSIDTSQLKISTRDVLGIEEKETHTVKDKNGNNKRIFIEPIPNFRQVAKKHLENVFISHKAKNKVVTINKNKISGKNIPQTTLTPRGQLHKETIYGKYHYYETKEVTVNASLTEEVIQQVCKPKYREALLLRLRENNNEPKKAFSGSNAINKKPIFIDDEKEKQVPSKVKIRYLVTDYSIKKEVTPVNFENQKSLDKILDSKIKQILSDRLKEFNNNAKEAFSNLEQNPIWLNKEKGIQIKRVKIKGISTALAIHDKKDHLGNLIVNEAGEKTPSSFVSTGNNHHVAIYRDDKGKLQENIVSFFEATERARQGIPIIDKTYKQDEGWEFLFTMKQNELFVFPNIEAGFNPEEIDLLNPENKELISPHLFRVQKISTKNYMFRHHLESLLIDSNELRDKSWINIRTPNNLINIVKVRTNHLGDIVSVGED